MSQLTDILGLNLDKLGRLTFDEMTGEFTLGVVIKHDSNLNFTTTVQIAKFDFLNLYLPSNWFFDKKNLKYTNYRPHPSERLIKPFYSKNKGCEIIPNSSIIDGKGTTLDINEKLLKVVKSFEQWYKENNRKISKCFFLNDKYADSYKLSRFIIYNEVPELGTLNVYGTHYSVFPWNCGRREYRILYNPFNTIFLIRENNDWVLVSKNELYTNWLQEDLIKHSDYPIVESLKAISTSYNLRNGYRLSKFLIKCVLEGFFITYEKSNVGNNVRFIVKRNDNVESGVIYNYDSEGKSYWVFKCANTDGVFYAQEGKIIKFRGVDNNTQDILNSMIEVRKLAKNK
jgi:hypothetical protein